MKIISWIIGIILFCILFFIYKNFNYFKQNKIIEYKESKQQLKLDNFNNKLIVVEILKINSKEYIEVINISGKSEALKSVQISSEISGIVLEKAVIKGSLVKKNDLLCRIDIGTKKIDLIEAKTNLIKIKNDYDSMLKLANFGYVSQDKILIHKLNLDSAIAIVKRAEKNIKLIKIKAPFDGVIENIPAKIGSLLTPGMECATILDKTFMIIVVNILEHNIKRISIGLNVKIKMITGDKFKGKISYIAESINLKTKTFRVDILVENKKLLIRNGMTSQVSIELKKIKAHFIKKSLLTLDNHGNIGVRVVNNNNIVEFYKISILSDQNNGIWVFGLNDKTNIISIGHEYVKAGQKVLVVNKK